MDSQQGLAGSLMMYAVALFAVLGIIVGPLMYAASSNHVSENVGIAAYVPPPGTRLVNSGQQTLVPLARLVAPRLANDSFAFATSAKRKVNTAEKTRVTNSWAGERSDQSITGVRRSANVDSRPARYASPSRPYDPRNSPAIF